VCVPDTNECVGGNGCGTAACGSNSTCSDPSSACGNRVCTCSPGYNDTDPTGQANCVNINECAGPDPCGGGSIGTCAENAPGSGYACACGTGYTSVDTTDDGISNPTCACDLGGTWAIEIQSQVHWSGVDNIQDGVRITKSWALRTHTFGVDGRLQVHTVSCGGTTPDLCGDGASVPAAAYAQFTTNQLYEGGNAPSDDQGPFALTAVPRRSAAFEQPQSAVVLGMHLSSPTGTWPSRNELVGTQMSPGTNGSYWTNPDGGPLGVTVYVVPPGGISIDGSVPDPPFAYPATSSTCGGLSYEWMPGLEGGLFPTVTEVKRFEVASRVISGLKGNFSANSCGRVSGDVFGPNPDSPMDADTNGEMRVDGRFHSCTRVNSAGTGETGCGTSNCSTGGCPTGFDLLLSCRGIDFFDCTDPVQVVDDTSFIMKKTTDTTCAQVRARDTTWWSTDP
jgi:hypothetical protein